MGSARSSRRGAPFWDQPTVTQDPIQYPERWARAVRWSSRSSSWRAWRWAAPATTRRPGRTTRTGRRTRPSPPRRPPRRTAVDVSQAELRPIDEGAGVPQSTAEELPEGYVEVEYLLSGVAGTYSGPPDRPATPTGEELHYTTRLLVRTPEDPAAFSGRVVVEPFNTSGGADADVIWRMIGPMLAESGDVWVGVTVRTNSGILMQDFDATALRRRGRPGERRGLGHPPPGRRPVEGGERAEPGRRVTDGARVHGRLLPERARHRQLPRSDRQQHPDGGRHPRLRRLPPCGPLGQPHAAAVGDRVRPDVRLRADGCR